MKIINRKEFLDLPANTLFSKYEECSFGPIEIKGDTAVGIDFLSQQIADAIDDSSEDRFDILIEAEKSGSSFRMDLHCEYRDGFFDKDQLFAVWEKEDVKMLIDRLNECL
ncbi:hypothetical protein V2154_16630 [Ewingella sp. CoE-038-23]|uniref:hypothetical protein n=1 Tax=Ewingella docleensis TaxID=3118588 RepID=UPI0033658814